MAGKDEQQIIELEKKFWQSIVDNDVDTSVAMLDEGSVVAGAQGVRGMSHDDYRRMAEQGAGKYELKSFKFADVQVSFPTRRGNHLERQPVSNGVDSLAALR